MKRLAVFIAFISVFIATTIIIFSDWFAQRLISDFWPLDASRVGPNLVASVVQWIIIVIVASFIYPPFRSWIKKEIESIHGKLDRNALLSKHIIKYHPDIPNLEKEKEND